MAGNELRRLLFLALIFHMFNVSVVLGLPELGIEDIALNNSVRLTVLTVLYLFVYKIIK